MRQKPQAQPQVVGRTNGLQLGRRKMTEIRGEWVSGNNAATGPDDVYRGRRIRVAPA